MSRPIVSFRSLTPWTPQLRTHVGSVAREMAPLDGAEIFGLRPEGQDWRDVVDAIGAVMRSGLFLEGFLATEERDEMMVPVAAALAWRAEMPRCASLAMFGRVGHGRAMQSVYDELARRAAGFGARHGVALASVPVLESHRTAMRRLTRLGAEAAFSYGPVGLGGLSYSHMIWRFPDGFSGP